MFCVVMEMRKLVLHSTTFIMIQVCVFLFQLLIIVITNFYKTIIFVISGLFGIYTSVTNGDAKGCLEFSYETTLS
jgi:hypothetical protein